MVYFDEPRDRLLAAMIALTEALERFDQHAPDLLRCFAPLTEALWWAVTVDEGFRDDVAAPGYGNAASADADGKLLDGIRYARNRAGHQRTLTAAHTLSRGAPTPNLPFGSPALAVVWRPASQLPPGRRSRRGEQAYREHLEGQVVYATLRRALSWFGRAGATYIAGTPSSSDGSTPMGA